MHFLEKKFLEEGCAKRKIKLNKDSNEPQAGKVEVGTSTEWAIMNDVAVPMWTSSSISMALDRFKILYEEDFESLMVGEVNYGDDPENMKQWY